MKFSFAQTCARIHFHKANVTMDFILTSIWLPPRLRNFFHFNMSCKKTNKKKPPHIIHWAQNEKSTIKRTVHCRIITPSHIVLQSTNEEKWPSYGEKPSGGLRATSTGVGDKRQIKIKNLQPFERLIKRHRAHFLMAVIPARTVVKPVEYIPLCVVYLRTCMSCLSLLASDSHFQRFFSSHVLHSFIPVVLNWSKNEWYCM